MLNRAPVRRALSFIGISGIGWLMDFAVYSLLVGAFHVPLDWSAAISAVPAVTFVFFTTTQKTFHVRKSRLPLWVKYACYIAYQAVLLLIMAAMVLKIAGWLDTLGVLASFGVNKYLSKILVTPFTMAANYFVLRQLIERM